ncbi:hypothetical protein FWD20_00570 [Candidatus Saccharibacteria bacterium]|nr:hypothetical protein [Candidatus Saccharibacteria bacterium]
MAELAIHLIERYRAPVRRAMRKSKHFEPHVKFMDMYQKRMIRGEWSGGEGPLLSAEIVEAIENGVKHIVIIQPYSCLAGKVAAMSPIARIKELYPDVNIQLVERRIEDLEGTHVLSRVIGLGENN